MQSEQLAALVVSALKTALAPLAGRVTRLEAHTIDPRPGVLELTKELTVLRERIAVLETRAPVPGPTGLSGKDGADGLGFEDLDVEHDGERGVLFRFTRGDKVKEFAVAFPCLLWRGTFVPGTAYQPGDIVTHGGSAWHCQKSTTTRPETFEGAAFWKLMVKRGDKGRDLRDVTAPAPIVRRA